MEEMYDFLLDESRASGYYDLAAILFTHKTSFCPFRALLAPAKLQSKIWTKLYFAGEVDVALY